MALNDTRLRNLKPSPGKAERLVADGNGLYIQSALARPKSPVHGNFAAERVVA